MVSRGMIVNRRAVPVRDYIKAPALNEASSPNAYRSRCLRSRDGQSQVRALEAVRLQNKRCEFDSRRACQQQRWCKGSALVVTDRRTGSNPVSDITIGR